MTESRIFGQSELKPTRRVRATTKGGLQLPTWWDGCVLGQIRELEGKSTCARGLGYNYKVGTTVLLPYQHGFGRCSGSHLISGQGRRRAWIGAARIGGVVPATDQMRCVFR